MLYSNLRLFENWADKLKLSLNSHLSKKAIEVIFSKATINTQRSYLIFDNAVVYSKNSHSHIGMILDKKFTFTYLLNERKFLKKINAQV